MPLLLKECPVCSAAQSIVGSGTVSYWQWTPEPCSDVVCTAGRPTQGCMTWWETLGNGRPPPFLELSQCTSCAVPPGSTLWTARPITRQGSLPGEWVPNVVCGVVFFSDVTHSPFILQLFLLISWFREQYSELFGALCFSFIIWLLNVCSSPVVVFCQKSLLIWYTVLV